MNLNRQRIETVLRAIIHEIRAERVTFLAGSVAYNAFLSLLPLLFLILAIITSVGSESLEGVLIGLTQTVITPGASELLVGELREATVSVSIIGIGVLLWSALRIFRSLDMAFSDIYESNAENTFANQISDGLTVFASMTLVVMAVILVEAQIELATSVSLLWLLQRLVLFGVIAIAVFPMFYLFPDEFDMRPIEAVPGVLFTAFGLMLLQSLFGLYIEFSGPDVRNSVLASLIILLMWLYFVALVILIGAAINAVLTNRSTQVQIEPVIGGIDPEDRTSTTDTPAVDRKVLSELSGALVGAREVSVTVDGTRYDLQAPARVDSDITTSPVPFFNNTAHIELHWIPEKESESAR